MKDGFDYWVTAMGSAGGNGISYSYSTASAGNCSSDINIRVGSGMPGNVIATASPSTGITINPGYLSQSTDFWRHTGAHELGHVFGWQNVNGTGCNTFTIMFESGSPSDTLPSSPLCGDMQAVSTAYYPNDAVDTGSPYEEPSSDPEDCWDVYVTRYYWYTDGTNWYYTGSISYFLYNHCGPPEY